MTNSVTKKEESEVGEDAAEPEADTAGEAVASVEPVEDRVEADLVEGDAVDGVDGDPDEDPVVKDAAAAELSALRTEFNSVNDRHLRLVSEFSNFRRRSEQERLSAWSRAQSDLMGKFLDVLDDLHRVADLDLTNATLEAIMEGIDLVERKFVRAIEDSGAEMIDPIGEAFDPEVMEAMMRVPVESPDQLDRVAQVFQKGYSLKGILVRAARVSVYTQG